MGMIMVYIIMTIVALCIVRMSLNNDRKNVLIDKENKEVARIMGTPLEEITGIHGLLFMDGLEGVEEKREFSLYANKHKLVIRSCNFTNSGHKQTFEIPSERIKQYDVIAGTEIVQSKKNMIGRAAVGGLLFGGAGAIVGGMSATDNNGTKEKEEERVFFIVNYKDANGETARISFLVKAFIKDPKTYETYAIEFSKLAGIEYKDLKKNEKDRQHDNSDPVVL